MKYLFSLHGTFHMCLMLLYKVFVLVIGQVFLNFGLCLVSFISCGIHSYLHKNASLVSKVRETLTKKVIFLATWGQYNVAKTRRLTYYHAIV